MKLYLVMIVKGSVDAEHLDRCLMSIVPHVEGVCILETKTDIVGVVRGVAERICSDYDAPLVHDVWADPNAHATKFWISDFSIARNMALELLPDEATHWCWIDADTTLENGSLWRAELSQWVESEKPDGPQNVVMRVRYDYDHEGVNCTRRSTADMVMKRGCATWSDPLHEQLCLNVSGISMFDATKRPYHLRHFKDRRGSAESTERNLWIMQSYRERNGGIVPVGLRIHEAGAYLGMCDFERACELMEEVLAERDLVSPEHYYQTLIKLGATRTEMGDMEKALDAYGLATVAEPVRGTTWAYLAALYNRMGRYEEAMAAAQRAIDSEGADEGGNYNPSFLAFQPLNAIAVALEGMGDVTAALGAYRRLQDAMRSPSNLPQVTRLELVLEDRKLYEGFGRVAGATGDESVWKKAPERLRIFPEVARALMRESCAAPSRRVDIWCGSAVKPWGPSDLATGLGGSEEAVVFLSRELARIGYEVTVFAQPKTDEIGTDDYGVEWMPHYAWQPSRESIFVQWRGCHMFERAKSAVQRYAWLHDKVYMHNFTDRALALTDGVFCLSEFHASGFDETPWREKVILTKNGLDPSYFLDGVIRRPRSFAYYSSPDRGLDKLLDVWTEVRSELIDATLDIYYGFTPVYDEMSKTRPHLRVLRSKIEKQLSHLRFQGVTMHGMVGHDELAESMAATAFYVTPTMWPETSAITAMKVMSQGCIPITSRFPESGQVETIGAYDLGPEPPCLNTYENDEDLARWRDRIIEVASLPEGELPFTREAMKTWARQTYSWEKVAEQWSSLFSEGSQSESSQQPSPESLTASSTH